MEKFDSCVKEQQAEGLDIEYAESNCHAFHPDTHYHFDEEVVGSSVIPSELVIPSESVHPSIRPFIENSFW